MTVEELIQQEIGKCSKLECDGTVRVLNYALTNAGIKHTVYTGMVINDAMKKTIPLHYWIELEDGRIVDYKCQMWLGPTAPNGIFFKNQYPDFKYLGKYIHMKTPELIYDILTAT
jgi:hypothetical protein